MEFGYILVIERAVPGPQKMRILDTVLCVIPQYGTEYLDEKGTLCNYKKLE